MVYPQWQRALLHPFFLAAPILRLVWLLCLPDIPSGYSLDRVYRICGTATIFVAEVLTAESLFSQQRNSIVWVCSNSPKLSAKGRASRTNAKNPKSSWQMYPKYAIIIQHTKGTRKKSFGNLQFSSDRRCLCLQYTNSGSGVFVLPFCHYTIILAACQYPMEDLCKFW